MIGNQATMATINNTLTSYSVALRSDSQGVLNFYNFVVKLGLPGLEALGYTPADAQAVITAVSYMANIAQIFFGTANLASTFNFADALASLSAGQ